MSLEREVDLNHELSRRDVLGAGAGAALIILALYYGIDLRYRKDRDYYRISDDLLPYHELHQNLFREFVDGELPQGGGLLIEVNNMSLVVQPVLSDLYFVSGDGEYESYWNDNSRARRYITEMWRVADEEPNVNLASVVLFGSKNAVGERNFWYLNVLTGEVGVGVATNESFNVY